VSCGGRLGKPAKHACEQIFKITASNGGHALLVMCYFTLTLLDMPVITEV
jgi:hypothetical protein